VTRDVTDEVELRCDRPAKKRVRYASQQRVKAGTATADLLDDLRGERVDLPLP